MIDMGLMIARDENEQIFFEGRGVWQQGQAIPTKIVGILLKGK